ncbi:hypothetical protein [Bifidobacterium sp. SO1]|uniref:hypothetical protein n=1 Tax=Bifidobacterium sp. SO1 TaxID=2809029 RepID=UPI001BDD83A6|nr:hypothetical protein [Bifidobacterium sp. SO1]MBT1161711.1 hypothetical protein [Bifidobacterium sp. SO1]
MVRDATGRSHVAKGRPDGGQYDTEHGNGNGADDITPPDTGTIDPKPYEPYGGWSDQSVAETIGLSGIGSTVNRSIWDEYTTHPRKRSYTVEGEKLTRIQMHGLARALAIDACGREAKEWNQDEEQAKRNAAEWFDANHPAPKGYEAPPLP